AVPVPAALPRLLLGREMADLLLFVSQRAHPAAHDGGRAWWSTLVRVVPGMAGLGGVPVALAVGHRPRRRPARPARPVRVPA
nr:DUF1731 domain-containing protein [Thermoanaerobacterales bacterium]